VCGGEDSMTASLCLLTFALAGQGPATQGRACQVPDSITPISSTFFPIAGMIRNSTGKEASSSVMVNWLLVKVSLSRQGARVPEMIGRVPAGARVTTSQREPGARVAYLIRMP